MPYLPHLKRISVGLGFMLNVNYIAKSSPENDLIGSLYGSDSNDKIFSKN
jgi:hypothetical protein